MTTNELLNEITKEIEKLSNKDTSNTHMDILIARKRQEEYLINMRADITFFIREYVEKKESTQDDI